MPTPQLVWLKRDLRVEDHAPLARAAEAGPVEVLYVVEPSELSAPEHHPARTRFVLQCLGEVDAALRARGAWLRVEVGEVVEVLDRLHGALGFGAIWSHQETGSWASFMRDRAVRRWCRDRGVAWHELLDRGVSRGRAARTGEAREGWARAWTRRMRAPCVQPPVRLRPATPAGPPRLPSLADLGLPADPGMPDAQPGGRSAAEGLLASFLARRAEHYLAGISSPARAWTSGSRLSPHLAFGTLSAREVFQATAQHRQEAEEAARRGDEGAAARARGLAAFESRLRWRCHFTQKLESQPRLQHEEMNPALADLRPRHADPARLAAWSEGRTGLPLVDACQALLRRSGWLNFRMRAMLVSVATHHLWLDWRPVAEVLARRFLDLDPGIHYPQIQMQAGTQGINAHRIYDPRKQAREQDPDGAFVRAMIPALARVPTRWIHAPHRMPPAEQRRTGCVIGRDYPAPVVDVGRAAAEAKRRLETARDAAWRSGETDAVLVRHGSRRRVRWGRREG